MLAVGILLGYKMNDKADMSFITSLGKEGSYPIGRVEEVLRYIDSKYVTDIDTDSLSSIAINSVINALDPHSMYISPADIASVNENMEGNFTGIGIESLYLNDTVNIVKVIQNGPSQKVGLKAFDQLIYIGDKNVAGTKMLFEEIRNLLRGSNQINTVEVKIKRNGNPDLLSFNIPLEKIELNSAELAYMIDDSIGIIKIDQFSEKTYEDFMKSLEYLSDSMRMKHLIIDLRDNPGGILPQVTKIINQLITDKGRIIVYTEGDHSNKTEYKTNGKVFFNIDRLAILINENSASASEILAGVVQDWDRGAIIGRRSYGKGLVQEQYDLSNGGAVRLTIAKYFTPAGRSIQKDYSQRMNYDNDLQNRLDKGYLTDRDTSEGNKAIKTLMLGRPIYSNYGISPDIFIKADDDDYNEINNIISSYTYEYMYTLLKDQSQYRTNLSIDDKLIVNFISYIKNIQPLLVVDELDGKMKNRISRQLQFNYDVIMKSKVAAEINSYKKDPFIIEATKYLISKKSLSDLK